MKKMELRQKKYLKRICSLICIFTLIIQPVGFATSFEDTDNTTSGVQEPISEDATNIEKDLEDPEMLGIIDITPPEFIDIKINGESIENFEIEVPGSFEIEIETSDDISGLEWGTVYFTNIITGKSIGSHWDPGQSDGNYLRGTLILNEFQYPGKYYLSNINLSDKAGNSVSYSNDYNSYNNVVVRDLDRYLEINVINEGESFIISSNLNNPDLADEIKSLEAAPDGAPIKIGIDYNNSGTLSKEIFEAIAGENKQIILEGGVIQWVFNGTDIDPKNIKDIDLKVNISPLNQINGGNSDKIENIIGDTPSYVLSFPNNGALPGPATIRLKVDYAFVQYMGRNDLNVYYYDSLKNELVLVKDKISVSGDGYIEFVIDHNSDFVVTKGSVSTKPPIIPGTGGSGGGSGSGGGGSIISKPISFAEATAKLTEAEKKEIVSNFYENTPYTFITQKLSLDKLREFTNNKFTDVQLNEIIENPELLKELGFTDGIYTRKVILNPIESGDFTDVSHTHWAYETIKKAAKLGLVAGMPDGSFAPNKELQMADTFTFLDRLLLLNDVTEMKLNRTTVEKYITDTDHWAFANTVSIGSKLTETTLATVSKLGDKPITRGLLAQILFEITDEKIEIVSDKANFVDTATHLYKDAIDYCVQTGLLVGTSADTMSPDKALTRAELMSIIIRLNDKI